MISSFSNSKKKLFLKNFNIEELNKLVLEILEGKNISDSQLDNSKISYRTKQITKWLYSKYEDNIYFFTDLSKTHREKLQQNFITRVLEIADIKESKISNSIKFALKTIDNDIIESVLMKHPDRYTLCISSQVGCNVGCVFCASGMFGLKRNLETYEIVEQLFLVQKFIFEKEGKKISNIVFMGMGEPLINYKNVIKALEIFTNSWGFNISKRNITISTSGILPRMYDLVRDGIRVKLALSLHSPFQEQREKLIPIAKKYHINDLLQALEYYYLNTKRRVTIEYILIKNVNDTTSHAKELVKLLRNYNMKVWVNLIPYNRIGDIYLGDVLLEEPDLYRIKQFEEIVRDYCEVSVRWSLGRDIDAACGQLRRKTISL